MNIAEKLVTIAQNIQKVYDAGYSAGKGKAGKPFVDSSCIKNFYGFFRSGYCDLSQLENVDVSKATSVSRMFMENKAVENVPVLETGVATEFDYMFYNCTALKRIDGIDISKATNVGYMLRGCSSLVEIRFNGSIAISGVTLQNSPLLSRESFESVIGALSDVTSELTMTFSEAAKNATFSEDEWNELISSKPNWTINLI